jgi:hypothetical protein
LDRKNRTLEMKKKGRVRQTWWLMGIIPDTLEVGIGGLQFEASVSKEVSKTES